MKSIIKTSLAPEPIGPYSQAVVCGNLVFVSGQVGKDAATGNIRNENIEVETKQVMNNIKVILEAAGSSLDKVLKTTIFLTSMDYFGKVNTVYASYFSGNYPARETVEVSRLPANVNVEISVIAEI
jgi:2-iminobutanoate/2-iminopropanoate deaminase